MSPTLKLYAIQGSCALAPHILLRESALPFTTQIWSQAEIKKNGGMPSELLAINPKGKVPCLQVDDEVVTEGVAIMTYISQLAGAEKGLFGKGPMETVRCYEWLGYLASTLHAVGFGMVIHPGRFVDVADGSLDSHVRAAGIKTARDCFKYIDAKLEGKKWAVGDDFSAVDAYLLVFYRWGVTPAGIAMEQDYPNYARLVAAVKERESVKEAFKAEGIN